MDIHNPDPQKTGDSNSLDLSQSRLEADPNALHYSRQFADPDRDARDKRRNVFELFELCDPAKSERANINFEVMLPDLLISLRNSGDYTVGQNILSLLALHPEQLDRFDTVLLQSLEDPEVVIREAAADAIGQLGVKGKFALEAMEAVLKSDRFEEDTWRQAEVKVATACAIRKVDPGNKLAFEHLLEVLKEGDRPFESNKKYKVRFGVRAAAIRRLADSEPASKAEFKEMLEAWQDLMQNTGDGTSFNDRVIAHEAASCFKRVLEKGRQFE